jgi:hypothetical protein
MKNLVSDTIILRKISCHFSTLIEGKIVCARVYGKHMIQDIAVR